MKKIKTMWEPIINCGYCAGSNPLCWDGTLFQTEQECEDWIEENMENFTQEELAGCVYPFESISTKRNQLEAKLYEEFSSYIKGEQDWDSLECYAEDIVGLLGEILNK